MCLRCSCSCSCNCCADAWSALSLHNGHDINNSSSSRNVAKQVNASEQASAQRPLNSARRRSSILAASGLQALAHMSSIPTSTSNGLPPRPACDSPRGQRKHRGGIGRKSQSSNSRSSGSDSDTVSSCYRFKDFEVVPGAARDTVLTAMVATARC
jgi:hypothetical protein